MAKSDFVSDAFKNAVIKRAEYEEKKFDELIENRSMNIMMAAIECAGIEEMTAVIGIISSCGLELAMHKYERALMALSFHEGMNAPRLEDEK